MEHTKRKCTFQNNTKIRVWSRDTIGCGDDVVRGVNLGGWLVLEPWITPRFFEQVKYGTFSGPPRFQYQKEETAFGQPELTLLSNLRSLASWPVVFLVLNRDRCKVPASKRFRNTKHPIIIHQPASLFAVQVNVGQNLDKIVDEWTHAQYLDSDTYMERMVCLLFFCRRRECCYVYLLMLRWHTGTHLSLRTILRPSLEQASVTSVSPLPTG